MSLIFFLTRGLVALCLDPQYYLGSTVHPVTNAVRHTYSTYIHTTVRAKELSKQDPSPSRSCRPDRTDAHKGQPCGFHVQGSMLEEGNQ
jgi:hypothetical protein